jgi:hypothetical protein
MPYAVQPDLITLIISDEEHKLLSSSLCSFHQLPVSSSLKGPNIHNNLLSSTFNLYSFLKLYHMGRGDLNLVLCGCKLPFSSKVNGLAVCQCDPLPAGSHVS